MMRTTQHAFHPMRGHVADGTQVTMRDGTVLTVKSVMNGWELRSEANIRVGQVTNDATILTRQIVHY